MLFLTPFYLQYLTSVSLVVSLVPFFPLMIGTRKSILDSEQVVLRAGSRMADRIASDTMKIRSARLSTRASTWLDKDHQPTCPPQSMNAGKVSTPAKGPKQSMDAKMISKPAE